MIFQIFFKFFDVKNKRKFNFNIFLFEFKKKTLILYILC